MRAESFLTQLQQLDTLQGRNRTAHILIEKKKHVSSKTTSTNIWDTKSLQTKRLGQIILSALLREFVAE